MGARCVCASKKLRQLQDRWNLPIRNIINVQFVLRISETLAVLEHGWREPLHISVVGFFSFVSHQPRKTDHIHVINILVSRQTDKIQFERLWYPKNNYFFIFPKMKNLIFLLVWNDLILYFHSCKHKLVTIITGSLSNHGGRKRLTPTCMQFNLRKRGSRLDFLPPWWDHGNITSSIDIKHDIQLTFWNNMSRGPIV